MRSLLSWFAAPAPGDDPKTTLQWVRRMEIAGGVAAVLLAVLFWGEGWWPWVLIAAGLLGLSPWPGAQAILRKAERKPGVLVTDPERRRARARRTALILAPLQAVIGGVVGYLLDGWPAAITMAALLGAGGALGAWWVLRRVNA